MDLSARERAKIQAACASGLLHSSTPQGVLERLLERSLDERDATHILGSLDRYLGIGSNLGGPMPDLVLSGPALEGVFARKTGIVFDELVQSARDRLLIASYTYFDGAKQFKLLAERMDACPELRVTMALNVNRVHGEPSLASQVHSFARRFWERDWPGKARPEVYYDPRSLETPGAGVLHAKVVVVDGSVLFVTSANLTESAQDKNIEVGLLVRDRSLAQSTEVFFRSLIEQMHLCLLPGSSEPRHEP